MSGLRRTQPDSDRLIDSDLLPLSQGRPQQEPMMSPHPQQLLIVPMDQAPSSARAVWLYQAGQMPPNIANIMDRKELDVLLRALNREVVEACIHMDAALHAPEIDLGEGSSSGFSKMSMCSVVTVVLALVFFVMGPPVVSGILSGIAIESVMMAVGWHYREDKPWIGFLGAGLFFVGMPMLLISVISQDLERSQREEGIGFGVTLMAWSLFWFLFFTIYIGNRSTKSMRASLMRLRITSEDPMAGMAPTLLDNLGGGQDKEPGKYFRSEHRREVLFASHCNAQDAVRRDERRVLIAVHYVMQKAMAIHPQLRWTKEEATCTTDLPSGLVAHLRIPIIRVSEGQDSFATEQATSALRALRWRGQDVPFAALVHHASQPDPETGETLVDDVMMRARRQAFLALHGMGGEGHPVDEALPPMTGAVEELVRQHQQPMSSAVAPQAAGQMQGVGMAANPGRGMWDGGGGYGGVTNQFNPLSLDADGAAKKKAAEEVGGDAGGAGGRSVV